MVSRILIKQVIETGTCSGIHEIQCNEDCPCYDHNLTYNGCTKFSSTIPFKIVLTPEALGVLIKFDAMCTIKDLLKELD